MQLYLRYRRHANDLRHVRTRFTAAPRGAVRWKKRTHGHPLHYCNANLDISPRVSERGDALRVPQYAGVKQLCCDVSLRFLLAVIVMPIDGSSWRREETPTSSSRPSGNSSFITEERAANMLWHSKVRDPKKEGEKATQLQGKKRQHSSSTRTVWL